MSRNRFKRAAVELRFRVMSFQAASVLRLRRWVGVKADAVSPTGVRILLIVLLLGTAAVSMSNGLVTDTDCEIHINGSVTYHACTAGPEHILIPGIAAFNVTVDPPNSTCGFTPQKSCTLVRITNVYYIGPLAPFSGFDLGIDRAVTSIAAVAETPRDPVSL